MPLLIIHGTFLNIVLLWSFRIYYLISLPCFLCYSDCSLILVKWPIGIFWTNSAVWIEGAPIRLLLLFMVVMFCWFPAFLIFFQIKSKQWEREGMKTDRREVTASMEVFYER